jgi:glycosyltransferase involved in cell wall biosynthesis
VTRINPAAVKILFFANSAWYLYNFRLSLAIALRDAGHEVLLVSPEDGYGARLLALGFRWLPAPMDRRSLNPMSEGRLILWLRALIAKEKVDLVHGFTIKCAVYSSIAARLAGVSARVNAVAGMGYVFTSPSLRARLLRPVVRTLLKVALGGKQTRLILQNQDDVDLFTQARLVDSEQVRLIRGSGVDCRRFTPGRSSPPSASETPFRVLLPARLLWDKGIGEFVAACRIVRQEGRRIEFLLAGAPDAGNPAAIPESAVRQWVDHGLITWLGHVEDMVTLFHSVDAVVLPTYREGLPKGLIEAAACGLPLIATDVPGCREVVTHEVDGLLVPPKDPVALAAAMTRLLDDAELRRRLGDAAREKALAQFDERIVIARTIDVYRELVQVR